ncbi:MAG: hypothetical protein A3D53_01895 [Candidatus Magasanikbacteria bacterium RIFCSPHIGHO2_02_FULL_45_10]|uniref:Methyltransferase domain-containing protein n=2 Tax=Candidatus Magasanikiibacteriota TaxID=1752731 RepID=A0A1F6MC79_9BACT|nr:MAG: hypothetical protein A3D53_01895 [Candidatus Magasanikbacteria bacterium RIFCSPHIGHO2_02_FULL_45_10]
MFWYYLFPSRYETEQMLRNYRVAHWGPFFSSQPKNISENFYREILLLAKKHINSNSVVLDIGCATGRLVFEYEKLGTRATVGIDTSKKFISFCNKMKEKRVKEILYHLDRSSSIFITGDVISEQFANAPFSFISCVNIIDRVENPRALVEKIASLLEKGGVALVVDPYNWDLSPAPKHLHVPNMKVLFDPNIWKMLEETRLPLVMLIDKTKTRTYNCHLVIMQKIS